MFVTEAIIMSIDSTSIEYAVHIPIFDSTATGQAILKARIVAQPGFINNYKVGDRVWVTFKNGQLDLALILGKIYQGADIEQQTHGGGIQVDSLVITGESATVPESTIINTQQEDFNTVLKLINKIKDLEIKNVEYQQEIQDLKDKIDQLATSLGANLVRDVDGIILTDIEGNTMEYATNITNEENFEEDNS